MSRRMTDPKEDYVLKWTEFQSSLTSTFDKLRRSEEFVDMTLSVEGKTIKCHKVVLCASSPYFSQLLAGTGPSDFPVIILNDVSFSALSLLVDFIYRGQVSIPQEMSSTVTNLAETLGIKGAIASHQQFKASVGPPPSATPPTKKRRLLEEAEVTNNNTRGHTLTSGPSLQAASNGLMPRPASAKSLRASGASSDLDNYSDIRPDILEMIKEEQKAKLMEPNQNWSSHSTSANMPGGSYCYQNQLQNMWQKCWNQNANVCQGLRYRERGPMKSWRSETMAEAIWSVLQEGLSLSQAARKHDIPYPTFVLYANRVHNMLGPSPLNGYGLGDLRPKGRGRPQRILLGQWPEDHVREVIRAVVFREGELSTQAHHSSSPPAPASSPQTFSAASEPKTEPQEHTEAGGGHHPLAAESRAAQAAFEAQMKQFYNNPFASQLLVASSKMFNSVDLNPFLQTSVKVEAPDEDTFEDAEAAERARSEASERSGSGPVDLATHSSKSIEAIASKLVRDVGTEVTKETEEINDNVFNCSKEIRKRMSEDKEAPSLVSADSHQDHV